MRMDYDANSTKPARRPLLSLLLLPAVAFLAGIGAMAWLLTRWGAAAAFLGIQTATPPAPAPVGAGVASAAPAGAQPIPAAGDARTERLVIDPEITRRVSAIEEQIGHIDLQSRAAVGNADRAEGLLVAFAARRALDRGVALGYIEGLLRERFGESQRPAVATIITASRQPVTLEELQLGLQEAGPELAGAPPNQDLWSAFKTELAGLITVRKGGTPSTLPAERLRRATRRLDAGQVDVALAEVLRMPGRENAGEWIAAAKRYVDARRALDTIETAALLDPRNPGQTPQQARRGIASPRAAT